MIPFSIFKKKKKNSIGEVDPFFFYSLWISKCSLSISHSHIHTLTLFLSLLLYTYREGEKRKIRTEAHPYCLVIWIFFSFLSFLRYGRVDDGTRSFFTFFSMSSGSSITFFKSPQISLLPSQRWWHHQRIYTSRTFLPPHR